MQRNPYWPLNGPSFFFDHRDSVTVYFTHCPSRVVGFGLKFRGADGKPTTESLETRIYPDGGVPDKFLAILF